MSPLPQHDATPQRDDSVALNRTTGPHSEAAERILRVLAANDGGVPQQELVSELDVSKATVSRRLSELEDADRVTRLLFRGRKLVWLAETVPTALETDTSSTPNTERPR